MRNFSFDNTHHAIIPEQISIYAGPHFVLSFQEDKDELFVEVLNRLQSGRAKLRMKGVDYLVYTLLDRIVDGYFITLDHIADTIEHLEEKIIADADKQTKGEIHLLKRELLTLRRTLSPMREAIGLFMKSDSDLIAPSNEIFIRDLYDHCIQAFDLLEIARDNLTNLQELYISELGFRTNSVMQVLTVVATIFIPLTFLVGVYGMNFDVLPELHYPYSYFILWIIMVLVAGLMLLYFRKRKWL